MRKWLPKRKSRERSKKVDFHAEITRKVSRKVKMEVRDDRKEKQTNKS